MFGVEGRSGFGTGSTGARVTVGGALLAEQVMRHGRACGHLGPFLTDHGRR